MLLKFIMFIPVICALIGIIWGISLWLYMKKGKVNNAKVSTTNKKEDTLGNRVLLNGDTYVPVQDYMNFETFVGNIIKFDEYNFAVVVRVSNLNIFDMSEDELELLQNALKMYYKSLDFYIKDITYARKIDLDDTFEYWMENSKQRTGKARNFANVLCQNGVQTCMNSKLKSKNNYIMVFYEYEENEKNQIFNTDDKYEEVQNMLQIRVDTVSSGLKRAGLEVNVLDVAELVDFYYSALNREKSNYLKVHEILESESNNVMSYYVKSRKAEPNEELMNFKEIVNKLENEFGLNLEKKNKIGQVM